MPSPRKIYTSQLSGEFSTYEDALAACQSPLYAASSVQHVDPVEFAEDHRKRFKRAQNPPHTVARSNRLLQYMGVLSFVGRDRLSVLDVGGGDGRFFYEMKGFYGDSWNPKYDVLEAPEVVAAARNLDVPGVRFFDDPEHLFGDHYSVVVFGGMLQIMPDPEGFFRTVMSRVNADWIWLTIFPHHDGENDRIAIKTKKQGEIEVSHPYTVFSYTRWASLLAEYGEMHMWFDMANYHYSLDGETHVQRGYLIKCHNHSKVRS